ARPRRRAQRRSVTGSVAARRSSLVEPAATSTSPRTTRALDRALRALARTLSVRAAPALDAALRPDPIVTRAVPLARMPSRRASAAEKVTVPLSGQLASQTAHSRSPWRATERGPAARFRSIARLADS